MAASFEFAIIKLTSGDARDERLNVGLAVFTQDGLDVRVSRRLERVRAFSGAVDLPTFKSLLERLRDLDGQLANRRSSVEDRLAFLSRLGPIHLSPAGQFTIEHPDLYEDRIAAILRTMVDPEPAPLRTREKR